MVGREEPLAPLLAGDVGVDVHPAGKDDHSGGVDGTNAVAVDRRDDAPIGDADISLLAVDVVGRIKDSPARYA